MDKKVVLALIATILICLLLSTPVLAARGVNGNSDYVSQPCWGYGDKPGWGYGDTNHDHCGPPGWGYGDTGYKPGWGWGDTHHYHYGPPSWGWGWGYYNYYYYGPPSWGWGCYNYNHYSSPGWVGQTSFYSLKYRWKSVLLGEGVKGWLSQFLKRY
jgi:hypothetical protein